MKRSPAHLAERLVWQFYHRGAEGHYTKRFASFEADIQTRLLDFAEVREGEVPAIAAYIDAANWVLLTSQRLIWSEEAVKSQVDLTEVEGAHADFLEVAHAKMPHLDRFRGLPPPNLTVITKEGEMTLPCEPRGPFFGLMNVLLMVARMNDPLDKGPPRI
jgi:hypothetical protein